MILTGIIGNFSSEARQNFYVTGLSLILVNFLVARTLEMTNERYLLRAIEEYNRRNLPRIHLSPETNLPPLSSTREIENINISLSKTWSF